MTIQIIKLNYQNIFRRYVQKYDIYRDLYEVDLLGLEIRNLDSLLAHNLKSIVLANKEICYLSKNGKKNQDDFLIIGTISVFREIAKRIVSSGNEDIGYKVANVIKNFTDYDNQKIEICGRTFDMSHAHVMGILNVTPDSFSDGGNYLSIEEAVKKGSDLIEAGADILDIGGESTRPGAAHVDVEEESERVLPVIKAILKSYSNVTISLDTIKPELARRALDEGVKIINDISGLTSSKDMIKHIKEYNAAVVIMHMLGTPNTMQDNPAYTDVVNEVYEFLMTQSLYAKDEGVRNIIVDPGIGFGKRVVDNYEIINRLEEFKSLGFPILIGLSRKSFIGKVFNNKVDEREDLTLASETVSIMNGARFIRTHTVKNTLEASRLINLVQNTDKLINV